MVSLRGRAELLSARPLPLPAPLCKAGLREYYDPFSGRGMGAVDFSWSALVAELVQPDPAASSSYI